MRIAALFTLLCVSVSCATAPARDSALEVVLLQINDVYEIGPVGGGKLGGLARVATLKKELRAKNPQTFLVLAGDFVSPSAAGTSIVDGKPLAGRQMIAGLNAAGLDYAIFGNHEFDITAEQLASRIEERKFTWLAGNVEDPEGKPYAGLPRSHVLEAGGARIGLLAVTIDSTRKPWVRYADALASARAQLAELRAARVDAIVALTHLSLAGDIRLVRELPEIDLVIGGHEHENMLIRRGDRIVPIAKADANARSAYVHVLRFDPSTHRFLGLDSSFRKLDTDVRPDLEVARVVDEWMRKAHEGYRAIGFEPGRVAGRSGVALSGLESAVRNYPTALTDLVGRALLAAAPEAELTMFPGGGIRIDDVVPAGEVTEFDVLRMFPFGDRLAVLSLPGAAIEKILGDGLKKAGSGEFLQYGGVEPDGAGHWRVHGEALEPARTYRVATIGYTANLWKSQARPGTLKEGDDLRRVVIAYLRGR